MGFEENRQVRRLKSEIREICKQPGRICEQKLNDIYNLVCEE